MRAVLAALPSLLEEKMKDEAYKIYVTDCLQTISQNTASYVGGQAMTRRFIELIEPKPQDNRTGAEIAADVIKSCGLKVVIE